MVPKVGIYNVNLVIMCNEEETYVNNPVECSKSFIDLLDGRFESRFQALFAP